MTSSRYWLLLGLNTIALIVIFYIANKPINTIISNSNIECLAPTTLQNLVFEKKQSIDISSLATSIVNELDRRGLNDNTTPIKEIHRAPHSMIAQQELQEISSYIEESIDSGVWTEQDNQYVFKSIKNLNFTQIKQLRSTIGNAINDGLISMEAAPDF